MSATISVVSIDETELIRTLGRMLQSVLPPDVAIVRGQDNRVGVPETADFVTITPVMRSRLTTNTTTYDDTRDNRTSNRRVAQATQVDMQVDVFGPRSAQFIQIISTICRDEYSYAFFKTQTADARVLFVSEPRQLPWIGGENQYDNRWSVDVSIQANIVVALPQQFADKLHQTLALIK